MYKQWRENSSVGNKEEDGTSPQALATELSSLVSNRNIKAAKAMFAVPPPHSVILEMEDSYTPNDPVVHAIKKNRPDFAIFLIELGFACDKTYTEEYDFPCNACSDCKDYYYGGPGGACENPTAKVREVSAEWLSKAEEYNDLNKFIKQKLGKQ